MILSSRSLRIVLTLDLVDPQSGGQAVWVHAYAAWLAEKGHEVIVVGTQGVASNDRYRCVTVPVSSPDPWARGALLMDVVRGFHADIVHDTGVLPSADIFHPAYGSLAHNAIRQFVAFSFARRRKLLMKPEYRKWFWNSWKFERHQMHHSGVTVAVSQQTAKDLCRIAPGVTKRMRLVRYGIAMERFAAQSGVRRAKWRAELGVGKKTLYVMSAHNFLLKGVGAALKALAQMERSERERLYVVVAGAGAVEEYRAKTKKLGVDDSIRFLGSIEDMPGLYCAADMALHPTFHDACSLSTLEAIASRVPSITTMANGAADYIEDGVDGIVLAKAGDAQVLARAMLRCCDANYRAALRAGLADKVTLVSQERNFKAMLRLYDEVLAQRAIRVPVAQVDRVS